MLSQEPGMDTGTLWGAAHVTRSWSAVHGATSDLARALASAVGTPAGLGVVARGRHEPRREVVGQEGIDSPSAPSVFDASSSSAGPTPSSGTRDGASSSSYFPKSSSSSSAVTQTGFVGEGDVGGGLPVSVIPPLPFNSAPVNAADVHNLQTSAQLLLGLSPEPTAAIVSGLESRTYETAARANEQTGSASRIGKFVRGGSIAESVGDPPQTPTTIFTATGRPGSYGSGAQGSRASARAESSATEVSPGNEWLRRHPILGGVPLRSVAARPAASPCEPPSRAQDSSLVDLPAGPTSPHGALMMQCRVPSIPATPAAVAKEQDSELLAMVRELVEAERRRAEQHRLPPTLPPSPTPAASPTTLPVPVPNPASHVVVANAASQAPIPSVATAAAPAPAPALAPAPAPAPAQQPESVPTQPPTPVPAQAVVPARAHAPAHTLAAPTASPPAATTTPCAADVVPAEQTAKPLEADSCEAQSMPVPPQAPSGSFRAVQPDAQASGAAAAERAAVAAERAASAAQAAERAVAAATEAAAAAAAAAASVAEPKTSASSTGQSAQPIATPQQPGHASPAPVAAWQDAGSQTIASDPQPFFSNQRWTDVQEEPPPFAPSDGSTWPRHLANGALRALQGEEIWLDLSDGSISGAALWLSQRPPQASRAYTYTFDICLPWSGALPEPVVRHESAADPDTVAPAAAASSASREGSSATGKKEADDGEDDDEYGDDYEAEDDEKEHSAGESSSSDGGDDPTPEQVLRRISGLMSEMTAMETSLGNLREELDRADNAASEQRRPPPRTGSAMQTSTAVVRTALQGAGNLPARVPGRLRHRVPEAVSSFESAMSSSASRGAPGRGNVGGVASDSIAFVGEELQGTAAVAPKARRARDSSARGGDEWPGAAAAALRAGRVGAGTGRRALSGVGAPTSRRPGASGSACGRSRSVCGGAGPRGTVGRLHAAKTLPSAQSETRRRAFSGL